MKLGWLDAKAADVARRVPLGTWSEVVCAFVDGGFEALERYVADTSHSEVERGIAIRLVGQLGGVGAARALSSLGMVLIDEIHHSNLAFLVARALNEVLSFERDWVLSHVEAATVRSYLHRLVTQANSDERRAAIYLALRTVGDEISLQLLGDTADLSPPWEEARHVAIKAIRRRLSPKPGR